MCYIFIKYIQFALLCVYFSADLRQKRGTMWSRLFLVVLLGCILAGSALAMALAGPLPMTSVAAGGVRPGRPAQSIGDTATASAKTLALPNAPGIYGQLVVNDDPAPGLQVTLHRYRGAEDVAVLTATTSITGFFEFPSPPTPPEGWTYYALFGPNTTNSAYVYAWYGPNVTNYQAGETRDAGVLNIADVPLVAPANGATVTFPVTFRWIPRPTTRLAIAMPSPLPPPPNCQGSRQIGSMAGGYLLTMARR
jgi:hypothetical protein